MPFLQKIWRFQGNQIAWGLLIISFCGGCGFAPALLRQRRFASDDAIYSVASHHLAESQRFQRLANQLVDNEDEQCVDWFFAATRSAWHATHADQTFGVLSMQANAQYHYNLEQLLCKGQQYKRFDPRAGLRVSQAGEQFVVPVKHYGFPWTAQDFQWFVSPTEHLPKLLRCRHTRMGCGVPLVIQRCRNYPDPNEVRFLPKKSSFAATVLLRFAPYVEEIDLGGAVGSAVLEFHDPLRPSKANASAGEVPLAADLTAPIAEQLNNSPRTYLAGFVQAGNQYEQSRLTFLEPYQPGKTPVVFVHGLFSDPESWADMENDLRAIPGFCEHFQMWFFRYPTGQGFLRSAAELRKELYDAIQACDPSGNDPALRSMVLVGHSMGGLISKLQVTHSGNAIWSRFANQPFSQIKSNPTSRKKLAATFFFEPSPHVQRVIFIATPHQGANEASGLVGNIASKFVRESPEYAALHRELLEQNPGVFADFIQQRLPTSIDLLKPQSPILEAMHDMRVGCGVRLHNIMGEIPFPSLQGPSDGVVPLSSAWHDNCESAMIVSTSHSKMHRASESTREVARILIEHRLSYINNVMPRDISEHR